MIENKNTEQDKETKELQEEDLEKVVGGNTLESYNAGNEFRQFDKSHQTGVGIDNV